MLRIKELREEKGISQLQLSKEINTTQRSISRWENGEVEPPVSAVCLIADYFNVSLNYLCGKDDGEFLTAYVKPLNEEEKILLKKFNTLNEKDKNKLLGYLDALSK